MLFTNFLRELCSSSLSFKGRTQSDSPRPRRALSDFRPLDGLGYLKSIPEMLTTTPTDPRIVSDSLELLSDVPDSLLKRIRASKAPVNLVLGLPLVLLGNFTPVTAHIGILVRASHSQTSLNDS
jgi:hypothetical protein